MKMGIMQVFALYCNKGRVQKLKSAKVWSLTIEGGEGVTRNQILIQTSFYSVNLAIFSENLKNSE